MIYEDKKAKHAAYMREYNKRSEPHAKKILRDREYRQNNLDRLRAYDQVRSALEIRKAAKYVYGKRKRERAQSATKEYMRKYYQAHRTEAKEKANRRRAKFSPEEWSDMQRRYQIKHKFGITAEQFDAMLLEQGGRCALCPTVHGALGRGGRLHIDHDHRTGKVRGLLCMFCNWAISRLDNCDGWSERAEKYLKRPR